MKLTFTLLAFLSLSQIYAQLNDAIRFRVIDPNGLADETLLRLHTDASTLYDPNWDAWKLFSPNNANPSVYSKTSDDFEMSINSTPFFNKDTTIYMWMRAQINGGAFTMETENLGNWTSNLKMAIKDLSTGTVYPLHQNQTFGFDVVIDPTNDFQRFQIYYSPVSTVIVDQNTATFHNAGCTSWTIDIFDENWNPVSSQITTSEYQDIQILQSGNYHALITDTEFGLTDSLDLIIEESSTEDTDISLNPNLEPASSDHSTATIDQNSLKTITLVNSFSQQQLIFDQPLSGTMSIFSISGALMYSRAQNFSGVLDLPINGPSGIYFVEIKSETDRKTFKVIK